MKHVGPVVVLLGIFVVMTFVTMRGVFVATTNIRVRRPKHVAGRVVVLLGNFVATISVTLRGMFAAATSMRAIQGTPAVRVDVVQRRGYVAWNGNVARLAMHFRTTHQR
jgi:hypothetical protein